MSANERAIVRVVTRLPVLRLHGNKLVFELFAASIRHMHITFPTPASHPSPPATSDFIDYISATNS